jgi:hypothetical protein
MTHQQLAWVLGRLRVSYKGAFSTGTLTDLLVTWADTFETAPPLEHVAPGSKVLCRDGVVRTYVVYEGIPYTEKGGLRYDACYPETQPIELIVDQGT